MVARKKKITVKAKTKPSPGRKRMVFEKPKGLRVEDLKEGDIVLFNSYKKKEEGTPDEYHIILPNVYGNICSTLRVLSNGRLKADTLPCEVTWDYRLEKLKDHVFDMSCRGGEIRGRLYKQRERKKK